MNITKQGMIFLLPTLQEAKMSSLSFNISLESDTVFPGKLKTLRFLRVSNNRAVIRASLSAFASFSFRGPSRQLNAQFLQIFRPSPHYFTSQPSQRNIYHHRNTRHRQRGKSQRREGDISISEPHSVAPGFRGNWFKFRGPWAPRRCSLTSNIVNVRETREYRGYSDPYYPASGNLPLQIKGGNSFVDPPAGPRGRGRSKQIRPRWRAACNTADCHENHFYSHSPEHQLCLFILALSCSL